MKKKLSPLVALLVEGARVVCRPESRPEGGAPKTRRPKLRRMVVQSLMVASVLSIFSFWAAPAHAVTIDFDSLAGMTNSPGSIVPDANQLSSGFLSLGVSFSSLAGYVAVVDHSPNPTVSNPNVIGGVTADGRLSYGSPVTISFFDPSNPAILGVTDFVSIRGDQVPLPGAVASMEAFDVLGNSLGVVSAFDSIDGLTLSFTAPGIHSIILTELRFRPE